MDSDQEVVNKELSLSRGEILGRSGAPSGGVFLDQRARVLHSRVQLHHFPGAGFGFRVQGSGLEFGGWVWVFRFGVWGLGCGVVGVWSFGVRAPRFGFRVSGPGFQVLVVGFVFRVLGFARACTQHSLWQDEFLLIRNTASQIGPFIVVVLMRS